MDVHNSLKNIIGPDSSWFWAMLQTLVVGISLYMIYQQVKAQTKGNMVTTLQGFNIRFENRQMVLGRVKACKQFLANETELLDRDVVILLHFFEELGLWVKNDLLDAGVVWTIYDHRATNYWDILSPIIIHYRTLHSDETFYEEFEYLRNRMRAHSKTRGLKIVDQTEDEKIVFVAKQIDVLDRWLDENKKD